MSLDLRLPRLNRNRFNSKGQKGQLWLWRELCNQWSTPSLDLHLPLRKPKLHTAQGPRRWRELHSKAPMPKVMPKVQWKEAWDTLRDRKNQNNCFTESLLLASSTVPISSFPFVFLMKLESICCQHDCTCIIYNLIMHIMYNTYNHL